MARAAVIVATFNQPNALRLCLSALAGQTERDFEVVVADDGSDGETAEVARASGARHVWQENRGFRKAAAVNAAVRQTVAERLIFTDGDCVPPRDFVRVHLEALAPRAFACGGYVNVREGDARALTPEAVKEGAHERLLSPRERARLAWVHKKNLVYIALGRKNKPKAYGANLSVSRDAFVEVNGFDESFEGVGGEDSDLRNRLVLAGATPNSVWDRAWVFHLPKALDPKRAATEAPRRKDRSKLDRGRREFRAERGLDTADGS